MATTMITCGDHKQAAYATRLANPRACGCRAGLNILETDRTT